MPLLLYKKVQKKKKKNRKPTWEKGRGSGGG